MKRKLFTVLVVLGAISLTACQEDAAMEELLQDTELNAMENNGEGDDDDDDGGIPPTNP